MPSSFAWRDKKKNNKEKANKDAFKKWYEGKRKAKEMKGKPKPERARDAGKAGSKGGKGRGKGADAQGPARLKGMGRGAGAGLGQSFGTATGSFGAPASADKPPEGVSAGLLERLLATKRRLLNGGEETGRGGEASEEQAASGDAFSRRGKGKGDGKSKGKGDEKGKGKGKGKKRGWEEDDTGAPAAKKARPAALWLAPPQDVNREERVALNRKIAEHGQVKNLAGTRAVLADLEERGWANGHTYANAVNALCRCGDWQGAFAALKRAEGASLLKRGAGLTSGVIARTAMLRGFCEGARDLGRAKALLERMERMELVEARPNTRTANTFLRGCLLLGAVGEAESLLSRIENEWTKDDEWRDRHGCSPDASSYEMVALLLCQALRYEDASKVANASEPALLIMMGDEVLQAPEQYVWYYTDKMEPHVRLRDLNGEWIQPGAREVKALMELVKTKQKAVTAKGVDWEVRLDADGCYLDSGETKQYFGLVRDRCPAALQMAVPPTVRRVSLMQSNDRFTGKLLRGINQLSFDSGMRDKMLRNTFDALDKDGNGILSRMELLDMMRKLSPVKGSSITSIIEEFDTDGREGLSFEEFKEWMSKDARLGGEVKKAMNSFPSSIEAAFRVWDKNGDGSISRMELAQLLKQLNPKITKEQCELMVKAVDKDGNGKIDYSEFVAFLFPQGK
eukprot:TRINITY_DN3174_c0_g1_i2.p1 TRINITY_DN3174_c0_g1~~TRINITY_DN3174_c0_g1_i2.p1  ORF type:complete len:682 (+),score=159.22 TRINITY_DN3174_c0_g1_i2:73-2118(+)